MLSPENGRKNENIESAERFELGQVVATPEAIEALENAGVSPERYLYRHVRCDWGDISDDDKAANESALLDGDRIFSAYNLPVAGERIRIITEGDRSATTLMLPEDY